MNWILAFNLDFVNPKPMSKDEAEKAVQELTSKVSRQFTKGKMAYNGAQRGAIFLLCRCRSGSE